MVVSFGARQQNWQEGEVVLTPSRNVVSAHFFMRESDPALLSC